MNALFFRCRVERPRAQRIASRGRFLAGFALLALLPVSLGMRAQSAEDAVAEFKAASAALAAARLGGGAESEAPQGKALAYLDGVAVSVLNGSPTPDLETAMP